MKSVLAQPLDKSLTSPQRYPLSSIQRADIRIERCCIAAEHIALCLQAPKQSNRGYYYLVVLSLSPPQSSRHGGLQPPTKADIAAFVSNLREGKCAPPPGILAQPLSEALIEISFCPSAPSPLDCSQRDDVLLTADASGHCSLWLYTYHSAPGTQPSNPGAPTSSLSNCSLSRSLFPSEGEQEVARQWLCVTSLSLCTTGTIMTSILIDLPGQRLLWTESGSPNLDEVASVPSSTHESTCVKISAIHCPGLEDLQNSLPRLIKSPSPSVVVLSDPITILGSEDSRKGGAEECDESVARLSSALLPLQASRDGAWMVRACGSVWHYDAKLGQTDSLTLDESCQGGATILSSCSAAEGSDGLLLLIGNLVSADFSLVRIVRTSGKLKLAAVTRILPDLPLFSSPAFDTCASMTALATSSRVLLCDGDKCVIVTCSSGAWTQVQGVAEEGPCLRVWSAPALVSGISAPRYGLHTSSCIYTLDCGRQSIAPILSLQSPTARRLEDVERKGPRMDSKLARFVVSDDFLRNLLHLQPPSAIGGLIGNSAATSTSTARRHQESPASRDEEPGSFKGLMQWRRDWDAGVIDNQAVLLRMAAETEEGRNNDGASSSWPLQLDLITLLPKRDATFRLHHAMDPLDIIAIPPVTAAELGHAEMSHEDSMGSPAEVLSVESLLLRMLHTQPRLAYDAVASFADAQVAATLRAFGPAGAHADRARIAVISRCLETALHLMGEDFRNASTAADGRRSLLIYTQQEALAKVALLGGSAVLAAHAMTRWGHTAGLAALRRKLRASAGFLLAAEGRDGLAGLYQRDCSEDEACISGGLVDGHADPRNYRPPVPPLEQVPDWPLPPSATKSNIAGERRAPSLGERRHCECVLIEEEGEAV